MVRVRRVAWPYLFVTATRSRLSTWKDHSSRAEQMKRITYPKKEKRKTEFHKPEFNHCHSRARMDPDEDHGHPAPV